MRDASLAVGRALFFANGMRRRKALHNKIGNILPKETSYAADSAIHSHRSRRDHRADHRLKAVQGEHKNHLESCDQCRHRRRGDLSFEPDPERRHSHQLVDGAHLRYLWRPGRHRAAHSQLFYLI